MAAFNYHWSSERIEQPRLAIFDQLTAQLAELERKIDTLGNQPVQNTDYYQQQPINTPNYYNLGWPNYPNPSWSYNNQDQFFAPSYYQQDFQYLPPQPQEQKSNLEELLDRFLDGTEMRTNNQEDFTPELSYPQDFQYQPPPQEKEKSNLEELLTKFTDQEEKRMESQEATLRNIENHLKQIANAINNWPQDTLPSNTETNSKEEGRELYQADTFESGKVCQETVKKNFKRLYSDVEEDCEVEYKRSKIEPKEEKDEGDQAFDLNGIKQISPMSVVQTFYNSEEYIQVDLGEGKENNLDEFKFGGGFQSRKDAMQIKEKTKRRHEKIIFTIEPD